MVGGMDLIFPHHENEIAQSESLCKCNWVNFWLHNAFVRIDKEKMSKSLGNFFTLRDVFAQYDPMVVRFMILNHHYRSPLDFSFEDLAVAQKTYQRLCKLFSEPVDASVISSFKLNGSEKDLSEHAVTSSMIDYICDDLNLPGMWGVLFENFKQLQEDTTTRAAVKTILTDILGLTLIPLPETEIAITPEIQHLIDEREKARAARDWAMSDMLRDKLKELGYEAQDKKSN